MKTMRVGYAPIGVKFSPENPSDYPAADDFHGVSYCEAVHEASDGAGKALYVTPDSIEVCRWSPMVFGFRAPDPQFDLKVEYSVPAGTASILIAPEEQFSETHPPDVALVRAGVPQLKQIFSALGEENFACDLAGKLDRSALEVFRSGGNPFDKARVQFVNETLGNLNRIPEWREFTKWIFNRDWTTYVFDLLLDQFLANMSMCRNATVIPFLTGKANVSYFCTGGIAWGMNKASHMACGMPHSLFKTLDWSW